MRIRVDAPHSDDRRDQIERRVFERLDAIREVQAVPTSDARRDRVERGVFDQLAGIRGVERAEAVAPVRPRARPRWPGFALAAVAAAVVIGVLATRGSTPSTTVQASQLVVTPVGGASRFTVGDAVVDAGSDTSVEVTGGAAVTLALARGVVDCNVEPRGDRPPFRVVAGDVTVEVVGTRFAVSRTAAGVRVDVTHGKVRVTSARGESFVTAGETWSNAAPITATAPPSKQAETPAETSDTIDESLIDLEPAPGKPAPSVSPKQAYEAAKQLEHADPDAAARNYRTAAAGRDKYAALALFDLAELERGRGKSAGALRAIDGYLRRFPTGANVEDLMWLRVDIHRAAKQTAAMRAAATDYLKRFPSGTYAKPARRFADAEP